jgi:hypothetical protein
MCYKNREGNVNMMSVALPQIKFPPNLQTPRMTDMNLVKNWFKNVLLQEMNHKVKQREVTAPSCVTTRLQNSASSLLVHVTQIRDFLQSNLFSHKRYVTGKTPKSKTENFTKTQQITILVLTRCISTQHPKACKN